MMAAITFLQVNLKNSLNLFKQIGQFFSRPFVRLSPCWLSLSPNRISIHQPPVFTPIDVALPAANSSWDWTSAMSVSKGLLLDAKVKKRSVRVIISDEWIRCFAIATPKGMRSVEEIQQFVQGEFRIRFEDDPTNWLIDWVLVGSSILAMACPQALIQDLRSDLSSIQCRLDFLSAHSIEVFRSRYRHMPADCWMAFICHNSLSLACIQDGQLKGYWIHPQLPPHVREIAIRLERHSRLLPTALKKLDIFDPQKLLDEQALLEVLNKSGWQVKTTDSIDTINKQDKNLSWSQFVKRVYS